MDNKKIVLVTGGNRGIGFGCCKAFAEKGYEVILTSRKHEEGKKVAEKLSVQFAHLDVDDEASIQETFKWIADKFGKLDVLINNAGILLDRSGTPTKESLKKTLETNVIGPYLLCQRATPLLKMSNAGRIVNVSSMMGQLSKMGADYPSYRISKAALNAVTKIFAAELHSAGILVNSVCPGWVKTDMGGPGAMLEIDEGVDTIIWAAELPLGGPTGSFFQKRRVIDW